tara:strand:- start:15270 stop:16307 length:1038 start_codon:yes stop_codon:yes gene_type:complete
MKICWFGLYDRDYSRNGVLIEGLTQVGVDVIECNTLSSGGLKKYFDLIKKLRSIDNQYDYIYCAFPVNYNVLIAAFFQKKPIVVDAFFPLYEAYVIDRAVISKFSPKALVLKFLDWVNIYLSDYVVVDTDSHKEYWLKYDPDKIKVIPVGADTNFYYPLSENKNDLSGPFRVLFHGSYIPLQGVEVIVDAAKYLRKHSDIQFTFIGSGQTFPEIKSKILKNKLQIELLPWMDQKSLNEKLNESDAVLGIFGSNEKTDRVIPNKVFQGLAVGKPVITKRTEVMEIVLGGSVYLCEGEGGSLAEAILDLYKNPSLKTRMAIEGHKKFLNDFVPRVLGMRLVDFLNGR